MLAEYIVISLLPRFVRHFPRTAAAANTAFVASVALIHIRLQMTADLEAAES